MRPLTLVYSSDSQRKNEAVEEGDNSDAGWHQLDMFSSSRPDVLVFTAPQHLDFEELRSMLDNAHIKYVFDLRAIPNLVFNDTSRVRFFQTLEQRDIAYTSHMSMASVAKDDSGQATAQWLASRIGIGPVMVFCDLEPQRDSEVRQLTRSLTLAGVKFAPIYLSIDETLGSASDDRIAM